MLGNKKLFAFSRPIQHFMKFGDNVSGFFILWKGIDSINLGCNDQAAVAAGLTTAEFSGMHDKDCVWQEYADIYRRNDEIVP